VTTDEFTIETKSGAVRAQIIDSANIRVDMGMPVSRDSRAEIRELARESYTRDILVEGRRVSYTPVSLDRSYALVFVPDFSFPVNRTARKIAAQPDFPAETGIVFIQVFSREEIRVRSWESGGAVLGDECGCAAAALVASVVNGFTEREAFVHLRRGDVFVQWVEGENRIWITGPALYVFTGMYEWEEESDKNPP
jgi:diaminopimelate epimerase